MAAPASPPPGGPPIPIVLNEGDLTALDLYAARLGDPPPDRAELVRRILVDRLVHEGVLPPSRAYTGHSAKSGLRPDELTSENDG
jgi:hypothetical protein